MDLGGLADEIEAFAKRLQAIDYTEPLRETANLVRANVDSCFQNQCNPDGSPWAPTKDGKPALVGSVVHQAAVGPGAGHVEDVQGTGPGKGLVFGSGNPISLHHQKGTSDTPAREHIGVSVPVQEKILGVIADHIVKQANGSIR